MKGLDWGNLYEKYHNKAYDPDKISEELNKLYQDPYVKSKRGVFEYILGGSIDTKLLDVRVFYEVTRNSIYSKQTQEAKNQGVSNCPICKIGHSSNKNKIWKLNEMDADHVTAWSKGGKTDIENCQMLCKTHNRAKGNK